MKITNNIIQNINSFPALSNIVGDVFKTCQDPDSSIADLVKIIEKDQGITIDILRISNSPIYGFTREILNIQQAVSLFGMGTIKGFVISSIFRKSTKFNLSPYAISMNNYLDTCRECNKFVIEVFKNESDHIKNIIYPASFLMNVGTLIIANEISKTENAKNFTNAIQSTENIADIEIEFTGISATNATAILFEHWNFDIDLIDSIKNISKYNTSNRKRELSNPLKATLKCINFHHKYTPKQVENTKKFIKENLINVDLDYFDAFISNQSKIATQM